MIYILLITAISTFLFYRLWKIMNIDCFNPFLYLSTVLGAVIVVWGSGYAQSLLLEHYLPKTDQTVVMLYFVLANAITGMLFVGLGIYKKYKDSFK